MASVLAERLSRAIAFICAAILYITFGVIFLILCSDVILRYFAGSSLQWASEIPELLFPWLVMAGVVLAAQHGAHIATTFLADAVPAKVRKVLAVIGHLAIIVAYALLAVVAVQQIPIVADERSAILQIPGSVTYICLTIGFVLIVLVHIAELMHWKVKTQVADEHVTGAYQ